MSRRPVVITSILFATMWCAWAADVVVSGTVVDSSGAAISGAGVQVQSREPYRSQDDRVGYEWRFHDFRTPGR